VIIKNRDKFEHANNMRDLYAEGKSSKKSWTLGIDNVPKPKANDDGTIDWDSYYKTIHNKIQKMGLV
jgi:hypothetical protein